MISSNLNTSLRPHLQALQHWGLELQDEFRAWVSSIQSITDPDFLSLQIELMSPQWGIEYLWLKATALEVHDIIYVYVCVCTCARARACVCVHARVHTQMCVILIPSCLSNFGKLSHSLRPISLSVKWRCNNSACCIRSLWRYKE